MQGQKTQESVKEKNRAERIYLAVAYQDHWAAKKAGQNGTRVLKAGMRDQRPIWKS